MVNFVVCNLSQSLQASGGSKGGSQGAASPLFWVEKKKPKQTPPLPAKEATDLKQVSLFGRHESTVYAVKPSEACPSRLHVKMN